MHLIVYRILWCKAEILQELGEEGHPYMGKAVGFVSGLVQHCAVGISLMMRSETTSSTQEQGYSPWLTG